MKISPYRMNLYLEGKPEEKRVISCWKSGRLFLGSAKERKVNN